MSRIISERTVPCGTLYDQVQLHHTCPFCRMEVMVDGDELICKCKENMWFRDLKNNAHQKCIYLFMSLDEMFNNL